MPLTEAVDDSLTELVEDIKGEISSGRAPPRELRSSWRGPRIERSLLLDLLSDVAMAREEREDLPAEFSISLGILRSAARDLSGMEYEELSDRLSVLLALAMAIVGSEVDPKILRRYVDLFAGEVLRVAREALERW